MNYARIAGTGSYLPEKILTNADLEQLIDTTADWIVERTGVEERHIAAPDETTCDLAERASRRALDAAGLDPGDIDLIILGTTTPDHIFPSVATQLQHRLGCYGGPAFDVQAVCTGFVYAMDIANRFIRTQAAKRALVVGADTFTRIINWKDRGTCILFGDGAGAVVLEAAEEPGIIDSRLGADGRYKELLWVPAGVSSGYEQTRQDAAFVEMRGSEVFKVAVTTLKEIAEQILIANRMTVADVDWVIPHQANRRILAATAKRLGLPEERMVDCVRTHGNTSAASVPLALDVAVRDGRIQRGDTLLLEGFGGGFTWGAVLAKY
ncbi:MAG TPA: beta-ketoacyl-ACP synthase III [Candidatus Competibacteraceae bacterium]|nr:ketoacyl-ACP synthase III [Candidatus Competibacteraceae bacterium]MCP5132677.1 ketoacyl-ACP synthase III [Gammaproteobacteria bacterium]HPF59712.1 beta-ketoacyl-ACP synthase III [Candidatus Competibacteraceae bacterium]HRY17502.1 beta-ketoacyl-ACP synthase III [Candidatus Competibacteraceae bacterium]